MLLHNSSPFSILAGWAFADSVLHRLAPLWVGARGLEFTWDYILQGLEANANLVGIFYYQVGNISSLIRQTPQLLPTFLNSTSILNENSLLGFYYFLFSSDLWYWLVMFQVLSISLAALSSLMWLRKNKPKTLIPIIYACAGIVATMPSIRRCGFIIHFKYTVIYQYLEIYMLIIYIHTPSRSCLHGCCG